MVGMGSRIHDEFVIGQNDGQMRIRHNAPMDRGVRSARIKQIGSDRGSHSGPVGELCTFHIGKVRQSQDSAMVT